MFEEPIYYFERLEAAELQRAGSSGAKRVTPTAATPATKHANRSAALSLYIQINSESGGAGGDLSV